MNDKNSIGILGLGQHLPPAVRTNDFWPASFRAQFETKRKTDVTTPEAVLASARNAAHRIQLEAMLATPDDPFRGSVERRVLASELNTSDMEHAASLKALERSGLPPKQLDLIITFSLPTDDAAPTNAGRLANLLGATRANVMSVDTACCSFMSAVNVAQALIRDGQCRYALVACSGMHSRILDWSDPLSVNFGDGAAAAVVGPVEPGFGVLGSVFHTVSALHEGVCLAPKRPGDWFRATEPLVAHSRRPDVGREIVMRSAEYAQEAIGVLLDRARLRPADVTHYFSHQPVAWFNSATRKAAGLEHCVTVDTFSSLGSMGAANIPVNVAIALDQGLLKSGDVAVFYACGAGLTWAAMAVRWGVRAG